MQAPPDNDKRLVRVWNVNPIGGGEVRVATIEQGPRKPSLCEGCSAPCCRGMFRPILDKEEFLSKRFPAMFVPTPQWLKKRVPRAEKVAVLAFTENSYCNYFDPASARCRIWPNCPKGCLSYDCREDTRREILSFARKREMELMGR